MENEAKNQAVPPDELRPNVALKAEHSPLPWAVHPTWRECVIPASDAHKSIGGSVDEIEDRERFATLIARMEGNDLSRFAHDRQRRKEMHGNAALIVRAVNAHDALYNACKAAEYALQQYEHYNTEMSLDGRGLYNSDPRFLHAGSWIAAALALATAQPTSAVSGDLVDTQE